MDKKLKNLILLEGGASRKKIYRLKKNKLNLIVLDFSDDIDEFYKHINIYNILKDINISIPEIYEISFENHTIITEDFGDKRYDKILNKSDIFNLLKLAIDSLIIINNEHKNLLYEKLSKYDFTTFKNEINEFIKYYLPYKKINNAFNIDFFKIWENSYNNLNIEFNSFVHKDFELTNLVYVPHKKGHLKCGILDFQNAFIGFSGWDVFSLLENSRINFSNEHNEKFIKFFFENTYQNIDFDQFRKQYYFFNTSRQTRLLGRWVKFFKMDKNSNYLKYIDNTTMRLQQSLVSLNNTELTNIYTKIFNNINE